MNIPDSIIFKQHPQPMWIFDAKTLNMLEVNEASLHKYGYSQEEFLNLNLSDLLRSSEYESLNHIKNNINKTEESGVRLHVKKDGSLFYTQITIQPIEYEGQSAALVLSQDITEQLNRNELLDIAYNQLKYHINNSPLAIIEWDKNLKIETWTNSAEKIFARSKVKVENQDLFTLTEKYVCENEKVLAKEKVKELIEGDLNNNHFDLTITKLDGNLKYTRWHNSILKNTNNELISILSLVEDITNERLAEKELQKSQQLYKSLFDNSLDAIILADDNMRIIDINEAACQLLGYSFEELYMKSIDFITPNQFIDTDHAEWNRFISKGKLEGEFNLQHKSGERRIIEYRAVTNIMPGIHLSVMRDVTKRKIAESELKYQKIFMESAINCLPGLFYVANEKGQLIRWNKNMVDILGFSDEELPNINPMDFYAPEDREIAKQKIGEIMEKGNAATELHLITKEGKKMPYFITGKHFSDRGHDYIVGMSIDISKRKEAEEEIKKSLEEKEVLLSEVHHRVKNNLAVISGLMELQKEVTEDSNASIALNDSQMRVHTIAMIHEKLYQNENLSKIKFNDYIQDLTRLIRQSHKEYRRNINVLYDLDDVYLNVNQAIPCGLILNEVINNAFEHAFNNRNSGTISIAFKKTDQKYHLSIADNGVGFPDNFCSLSESLGLTLIRTLARQLGAKIKLKSKEGVSYTILFDEQ